MAENYPLAQIVQHNKVISMNLEKKISYKFNDVKLLEQALTHSSHTSKFDENYERLEFLGDRVLGLCVAKMLYDIFPNDVEGNLSQRYMGLVCQETVADVARSLELDRHIVVANEELRVNDSVLCDVCEALIGAIFIDGGFEKARSFIKSHWAELIEKNTQPPKDAKTALQEIAHVKSLGVPVYNLVNREGSEHEPTFYMSVSFDNVKPQFGHGKSKKIAEQEAAEKMLDYLGVGHGK
ncbi:MAG: ribonuclease III [Lactobacillaceae bacterium]|jgi:ribonuclease-3|nr:ribonuclease III [Lactobacillaceae bacterium]